MTTNFDLDKAVSLRESSLAEINARQEILLQEHLRQATRAPFYHNLFKDLAIDPQEINLDNFTSLPLTSRNDIE